MCGICGFTGKSDAYVLEKMNEALLHRGPDESGFYSNERISLGLRRLSVVDVETGHQPVHNEDRTLWSVFNGEIYNYRELRAQLQERGHRFYTDHSDSELIVHLYEEFGKEFPHKINGMFSIALWDENKNKLMLLRDRMGVKPLFYALLDGSLIFGSEIKSVLAHPAYSRDMNPEAIYHYFSFKNIPAPLTAFKNIYSLMPGEWVEYCRGGLSKERWWGGCFTENENLDEAQVKDDILCLLEDSVKLRMQCDVSYGAYLSGGLDSSLIVSLMSQFSDKPVQTFSLGYEDALKNKDADLFYAREVSRQFGTEHNEYIMSAKELVGDVEEVIEAFDQPFSGTISTFFLSKLISRHVKVALSGDGADELFGSYLSHRVAGPMHHFKRLEMMERAGQSLSEDERKLFLPFDVEFLSDLYAQSSGDEIGWRCCLHVFQDEEKRKIFSKKFTQSLKVVSTRALLERYFQTVSARDPLNRILEMEWGTQLPDQVLAFVDFLSMAHSVEVRSPFLDYRLVEYVTGLPDSMKIRTGTVKYILKKAAESRLPSSIIQRPKEGFVLPVFVWMVDQLKPYIFEVLSAKRLKRHDLLSAEHVEHVVSGFFKGNRDNAAKVWTLMMFQIWWEKYFG